MDREVIIPEEMRELVARAGYANGNALIERRGNDTSLESRSHVLEQIRTYGQQSLSSISTEPIFFLLQKKMRMRRASDSRPSPTPARHISSGVVISSWLAPVHSSALLVDDIPAPKHSTEVPRAFDELFIDLDDDETKER